MLAVKTLFGAIANFVEHSRIRVRLQIVMEGIHFQEQF